MRIRVPLEWRVDVKSRSRIWHTDPTNLKAYVDRHRKAVAAGLRPEPRWFGIALELSWPKAFAEADAR